MSCDTDVAQWETRDVIWEAPKNNGKHLCKQLIKTQQCSGAFMTMTHLLRSRETNATIDSWGSLIRGDTNSGCHFMHGHSFVWFFSLLA